MVLYHMIWERSRLYVVDFFSIECGKILFYVDCKIPQNNLINLDKLKRLSKSLLPDPNVAAACFIKSCWWEPSGMFFLGLNVFDDRLLLIIRKKLSTDDQTKIFIKMSTYKLSEGKKLMVNLWMWKLWLHPHT